MAGRSPGINPGGKNSNSYTFGSATLAEGENVNQNFINSSVSVKAGDQILGDKVVNYIVNVESATDPANREKFSELVNVVNNNTRQKTTEKILDDFKTERLHQPNFQVNPQMKKVKVYDYFKGNYEIVEDIEVTIQKSSWFGRRRKKVVKNQLRKEIGFHKHEVKREDALTLDEVWMLITEETDPHLCEETSIIGIVASAGSGKTTIMRRLARKSLDTTNRKQGSSHHDGFGMVHFIELKTIHYADSVKPSTLLFGGLFKNEADEENTYQWLLDNQMEAVLFFDGLDQATWKIDNTKNYNKINPFSNADTATIMYNILSGNLLPQAKIVFSAREFTVSELPAEVRPTGIITLSGLAPNDAEKLFVSLIGINGAEAWEDIRIMSPRLLNLVCVPVFLILTAVVMARDPTRPPPSTVTELYRRIIAALHGVENIRNRDNIDQIIMKLKAMAYRGMKEGRVVFHKEDMRKFGVCIEEVQDLIMKVPGNNLLSRHLVEGGYIFFFCHQSIQEFFAASFIAQMTSRKFSQFDDRHLHEERWSVVRRFVFGLVYEKSTDYLYKISNQLVKQHVLRRSIRSQLEKTVDKHVRMELFTAIFESDDDNLMKLLSVIDTSGISLSRDEAHIVGSLAARNERLDTLILRNCGIDDELLRITARCLKDQIHVDKVDFRDNNLSATALRSLLGHRRIESMSGNLNWRVVMMTAVGLDLTLKNKDDVVEISGNFVAGHFNMKECTVVLERFALLIRATYLAMIFDARYLKCPSNLYAKQADLPELSKSKLQKISKILLDCTKEKTVDWSSTETHLKKFQIELLDIAVNGQAFTDDYKRIVERWSEIPISDMHVNIHAMFYVEGMDEFKNIVEACKSKKIEYIRCLFNVGAGASLDDILSLVNNCNSKKVTLLYWDEGDMLRGKELEKVQKIATDVDAELEVLWLLITAEDVWQKLDVEFYFRRCGLYTLSRKSWKHTICVNSRVQ